MSHRQRLRMTHSRQGWTCLQLLVLAGGVVHPAITRAKTNSGQVEVSHDFQKTVQLAGGQNVRIENIFGEVRVHGGGGSREVKISATIRVQANSREEAESFAQRIQVAVEQAKDLRIATTYPNKLHMSRNVSYAVNYEIVVPSDAPVNIHNSFGNVEVSDIQAAVDVDNSHGALTAHNLGVVYLNNSFGAIELSSAAGNALVNDTNANVQVSDVRGTLELNNRFGNTTVHSVQGAVTIGAGNGMISVSDIPSANITGSFAAIDARNIRENLSVRNNNGNIDFSSVGGTAAVNNSFGNVTFSDVRGKVTCATTNGQVKGSSLSGANLVTIRNSFGSIDLSNVMGVVDAQTNNGKITVREARNSLILQSSFGDIEVSTSSKGARATTGNGGIVLRDIGGDTFAKTSSGSITVDHVTGNFTAENTNGSVTARNVSGDVTATTSFAGVTLESISGKVSVENQKGAIYVTAGRGGYSGCHDISLKTSFAPIRVRIPDGSAFTVSARTSLGRISTELPVTTTGNLGSDTLNGTIGNAAYAAAQSCHLQMTNANGNIEIAKVQ
jgi:hypothetical protein